MDFSKLTKSKLRKEISLVLKNEYKDEPDYMLEEAFEEMEVFLSCFREFNNYNTKNESDYMFYVMDEISNIFFNLNMDDCNGKALCIFNKIMKTHFEITHSI